MLKIFAAAIFSFFTLVSSIVFANDKNDEAAARRAALLHSYGTCDGNIRTTAGSMDLQQLIEDLDGMRATAYNWLTTPPTDWDDLHRFLPLAKQPTSAHGSRFG